jgi:serine/threonine protein kinase
MHPPQPHPLTPARPHLGCAAQGCLPQLDWVARTRVATEVCRGLVYLHLRRPQAVLHRDIKPENVLLDAHLTAKLADVGLAKFIPRRTGDGNSQGQQQNTLFTTTLAGTMGYMCAPGYPRSASDATAAGGVSGLTHTVAAWTGNRTRDPEYLRTGQVSFASDCYSFGVLLLQMITGRAPESNETPLQEYVEDRLSTRESYTSPAAGEWPADHAADLARLALRCAMARRRDRPNLAEEVLVRRPGPLPRPVATTRSPPPL